MAVGMLTMLGKGISDELGAAVQKASRRSPADRPHRFEQFANDYADRFTRT